MAFFVSFLNKDYVLIKLLIIIFKLFFSRGNILLIHSLYTCDSGSNPDQVGYVTLQFKYRMQNIVTKLTPQNKRYVKAMNPPIL